jgi:hypothetical protein
MPDKNAVIYEELMIVFKSKKKIGVLYEKNYY